MNNFKTTLLYGVFVEEMEDQDKYVEKCLTHSLRTVKKTR